MARATMSIIRIGHGWRVALLYSALTLVLAYPLTKDPGGRVLSNGADTNLFMWALAWDTHAFTHNPVSIFDANIYYPERHTLAYSENFIGSAFFAAPVLWLTHNPVLAMNLVALLSCVLCGLGAFVLARKLGIGLTAAVLSGLIFAFSPPRFFRLDQLHLTTIQWVPFSLAYLHSYLDQGRKRDLHLATAFFTLQALTSGHGAALLVAGLMIVFLYRLALGEPPAVMRRLREFGLPGTLLLVPAVLIIIPYRQVQTELQFSRAVDEFVTNASSFLASPAHVHSLVLSALSAGHFNDTANAYLFPGYLPLLLAAAAFLRWSTRSGARASTSHGTVWRRAGVALELMAIAALGVAVLVTTWGPVRPKWGDAVLFSIRSPWRAWMIFAVSVVLRAATARRAPFDIAGRLRRVRGAVWRRPSIDRRRSARNTNAVVYALIMLVSVWLATGPSGGLWPHVYWLPGLNFIRVPSRFILLAVLGLAMLAGMGFERLTTGMTGRRTNVLATIAGVWLVVEFAAIPLGTEPCRVEIPAIDRWLAGQPTPFAIAEVPLADETRYSEYMLHSTAHWQKTVEGYSGIRAPLHGMLFRQLREFPDTASLDTLAGIGVDYIVVHSDLYTPEERAKVDARLILFRDRLTLTHTEGDGRVYTLHGLK
jgi:hypothetical protein